MAMALKKPSLELSADSRSGEQAPPGDEQVLIEASQRGDQAALSELLTRHAAAAERVIWRLVGSRTDAEDILQQTLTTAVESFPRFRGDSAFETWLIGIAIGISRNFKRRRARHRALNLVVAAEPATGSADIEATTHGRRLLARMYEHLHALSSKRREVWVLHVLEGRTVSEIAALLGVGPMTTKSRLFLARRELRGRAMQDPVLSEYMIARDR